MNDIEPKKTNKFGTYIAAAFWAILFGCAGSLVIACTIKLIIWILGF